MMVCSIALRFWVSLDHPVPWILDDELIYIELARAIVGAEDVAVRGVGGAGLYFVYPALIAPAFALFDDPAAAYTAAKFINCVLMSSAAIPAYLLARRVLERNFALVVSLMTLAIPSMIYTAAVMQENVYYPAFLWSTVAIWRVLERPTMARQVVALLVIGFTFFIRNQAVVLVATLLLCLISASLLGSRAHSAEEPSTRWRRFWAYRFTWTVVAAPVFSVLASELFGFGLLQRLAGQNKFVFDLSGELYAGFLQRFPGVLLAHLADLDLYVGILPFAALIVLAVRVLRGNGEDASLSAFICIATWAVVCNLVMIAAFLALVNRPIVADRYLFVVTPFFFIALCRLVADASPDRNRLLAACAVAGLLPLLLDYEDIRREFVFADSLVLVAISKLKLIFDIGPSFRLLVVIGTVIVSLALFLPRRSLRWLPVGIVVFLVAMHSPVVRATKTASLVAERKGIPKETSSWIDDAVGRDAKVVSIWHGAGNRNAYWQTGFFNRAISPVMNFFGPDAEGMGPEESGGLGLDRLAARHLTLDRASGCLLGPGYVPIEPEYVLTNSALELDAEVVARDPERAMVLYRVGSPVKAIARTVGISTDGRARPEFTYTLFHSDAGLLELQLHSNSEFHTEDVTLIARVGEEELARSTLRPGEFRNFIVPYPGSLGTWCRIDFSVEGVGLAALEANRVSKWDRGLVCSSITRKPRPAIFGLGTMGVLADGWGPTEFELSLASRFSGRLLLGLWADEDNGLTSQEVAVSRAGAPVWVGDVLPGVQSHAEVSIEATSDSHFVLQVSVAPPFIPDASTENGDERQLGVLPGSFLFVSPPGLEAELDGVYHDKWTGPEFRYSVNSSVSGELALYLASNPKFFPNGQTLIGRISGVEVLRAELRGGAERMLAVTLPEDESGVLRLDFEVIPTTHELADSDSDDPRDLGVLFLGASFLASESASD